MVSRSDKLLPFTGGSFHQLIEKISVSHFRMSIENLSNRKTTIRQVKAARALLGWSQGDLAQHSGVSEPTIARLEAEDGLLGGRPDTAAKIIRALTEAGIEFLLKNGGGAGVRLNREEGPEKANDRS